MSEYVCHLRETEFVFFKASTQEALEEMTAKQKTGSRDKSQKRIPRRVTLKDVAVHAGVSVSTVSRVLNNTKEYPESTQRRINDSVVKLGYQADPMLRALAAYRQKKVPRTFLGTIAMLLIDEPAEDLLQSQQSKLIVEGIKEAERLGYAVDTFSLLDQSPRQLLRQLKARGIQGIMVLPLQTPGYHLKMDLSSFSAVRIGYTLASPELHMVSPSQFMNARMLVTYLREIGHRRIGFWLPREIDVRTFGGIAGGYLRERAELPVEEQLPPGLVHGWDAVAFVNWFRENRPDVIIGLEYPFLEFLESAGEKPVPFCMPAPTGDEESEKKLHIDENWGEIYRTGFQQLDRMIRTGEKGIPETFHRIVITGKLRPGDYPGSR